jgi:hypothetical protein
MKHLILKTTLELTMDCIYKKENWNRPWHYWYNISMKLDKTLEYGPEHLIKFEYLCGIDE